VHDAVHARLTLFAVISTMFHFV